MHSTSNHRRRMELFRDRHRIVQDLLVKNADVSREVSKIAEDSRTIVDRISLMGVDDPKYEPNFKKLSGDLRGLNDEINGVTKTQFSELRKHIIDSVHDEEMSSNEFDTFVETCEQQISEMRKKIEDEFLRLSNKFGRYRKLYETMKSSDTKRPKGDLKMGKN